MNIKYIYYSFFICSISFANAAPKIIYTSSQLDEKKFYSAIAGNDSIKTIQFNTSDFYQFTDNQIIKVSPAKDFFNIIFKRSGELKNKLVIKNLQMSGYKEIRIYLRHQAQIEFENCIFQFESNKGIIIYFDNDYLTFRSADAGSRIKFTDCQFINTCKNISDGNSYQLRIVRDSYPDDKKGKFLISNILIYNTKFILRDYPENLAKSFNSINIKRMNESDYVNNIIINGNRFEYKNMNYAHTGGIIIENANPGCNFSIPANNYYKNNNVIIIKNNILKTDSEKPAQGIFIQGPYDSIEVTRNIVSGFSGIIRNKELASPDGDIHLYGARRGLNNYSDDNKNITVKHNIIKSRGTGIRVSGGINVVLENNIIYMQSIPLYWQKDRAQDYILTGRFAISAGTGNTDDPQKQARNLKITKNKIYGNINSTNRASITENCGGIILFSPRDFSLKFNIIYSINNYGIVYFKHASQKEQSFGISDIRNNIIDYDNQTAGNLKSTFYSRYNGPFAGINVQREFHDSQEKLYNEELIIEENTVITIDPRIKPVIFDQGNSKKISNRCRYIIR